MLTLHTIQPAKNSQKKRKKIGRGGKRGSYSGKGMKGQKARSGVSGLKRLGMRQLVEQTHKLKGFKSRNLKPEILNLNTLNKNFVDGDKINPQILKQKKLADKIERGVKILGNGNIEIKLEIQGCAISKSAEEKIKQAGGKII
ncbi:MAG: uL15 family ribosomal protein [Patescibacteria group bacterium]